MFYKFKLSTMDVPDGVSNASFHPWQTASCRVSSDANLSQLLLKDYLCLTLGPQRLDLAVVVPLTLTYGVIFVTGLVGNVCTCLVIVRNRHMHTATNYYLFNLAVADVLTLLLGLPNDLSVIWQQYPYLFGVAVCKIRAMASEMTSYASVLTIVAFSTERYVAICHPFMAQKLSDLTRVLRMIVILWILACCCASPFAIFTTVHYVDYPSGSGSAIPESAFCAIALEGSRRYVPLFQFSTFAFFVVPLVVITVLYVKIGLKLRKSKLCRKISDSSATLDNAMPSRRAVLNILMAVVITFFICWAPFHAQRLLAVYIHQDAWSISLRKINEALYLIAGCFYYIGCTTNPILYNVMSKNYRKAFERTLNCSSAQSQYSTGRQSLPRLSNGSQCGKFRQQQGSRGRSIDDSNLMKIASSPRIYVIAPSPDTIHRGRTDTY